jgi:hypothetical protein
MKRDELYGCHDEFRRLSRFLPELRARRKAGRKLTVKLKRLEKLRWLAAMNARNERACCLPTDRCPVGPGCVRKTHRASAWPVSEPEVEFLKGDKWEPVSVNPGSRYSPRLTWKALRESGALA